jgi:DnaJ-class molecular chaperone
MSHAELCPVCKGAGKYENNTCHGCDGKGWIVIKEDNTDSNVVFTIVPSTHKTFKWVNGIEV